MIMESLLITTEEIGNHRIKIYYDTDAFCPCTNWDLAALYLFGYNDRYRHYLSQECNWREIWGKHGSSQHSLDDSLKVLIQENCDFDSVFDYIKSGKLESVHLEYDKSSKLWKLSILGHRIFDVKSGWHVITEFYADERRNKLWNVFDDLFDALDTEMLVQIIDNCGKDIFIKEWSTTGYSQGDYVSGVAYCTKERYIQMVSGDTSDWISKIDSLIDDEVKNIGMWMWGDVKGFKLEKKVEFTKTYKDGREPEEDFEWEEVDSCWGYFMETEELIQEVISEHDLKEEAA